MSFIPMACEHTEDVCQNCLEKVETTEDFPKKPKFSDFYHPSETQKKYQLLVDSALLAATGYAAYWNAKFFLGILDLELRIAKDFLKTLLD